MATIHISEAEAIRDFAGLMARVRSGVEVVIENEARAVAILRPAGPAPGRLLSEALATANARGSSVVLDGSFGSDLEAVIASHPEPLENPWD
jgi:antitoxin (DNA-binding transcriptional repressor) of toxin-antitoxin stability system